MSTDPIRIDGDLRRGDTKDDHIRTMDQGYWTYEVENEGRGLLRVRADYENPSGVGTVLSKREVASYSTLSGRLAIYGVGQQVRFRFTRRLGTKGLSYRMTAQYAEPLVDYNETPQFLGHEGLFGSGRLSGTDTKDEVERDLRVGEWEYRIAATGASKLKFRVYRGHDRIVSEEIEEEDGEVVGTFRLEQSGHGVRVQNKRSLGTRAIEYQFELNRLGD